MFSLRKEIILQDKSEDVRLSAAKSLGVLIHFTQDEDKFQQFIELLDICFKDSYNIQNYAHLIIMPSLALWSLELNKLNEPLVSHYLKYLEIIIVNV